MLPKFFEQIVSSSKKGESERTDVGLLLGLAAELLATPEKVKDAVASMAGEAGAIVEQSNSSAQGFMGNQGQENKNGK